MTTAGPVTVKHVERSGHQSLTQAISGSYYPHGVDADTTVGRDDFSLEHYRVVRDPAGNRAEFIAYGVPEPHAAGYNRYNSGLIFVMNEAGATVARYDLGFPG